MSQIGRAVCWQLAILVLTIALISVLSHYFPIVDIIEAVQQRVIGWGAWGAICYPLLFAVCSILLLPGGVLAVGGGFFFGLWWGFLIVFLGSTLAAGSSFALSRWVATRWFRRRLLHDTALRVLAPAVRREGWKIILLTQLHPIFPTSLLSYIYGLTRVRFGTFMFWASIGRIPGLLLYVYTGTLGQLGLKIMRGRSYPRIIEYWIWGGAFLITALLFATLARIAYRAMQQSSAFGRASEPQRALVKEGIHSATPEPL